jgi:hypothetical protein
MEHNTVEATHTLEHYNSKKKCNHEGMTVLGPAKERVTSGLGMCERKTRLNF